MDNSSIKLLMLAVVQEQDQDTATQALAKLDLLREGKEESALKALEESCRQRIEYLTLPLEGSPLPMPTPVPVTVGGATVFALPVERFEEI